MIGFGLHLQRRTGYQWGKLDWGLEAGPISTRCHKEYYNIEFIESIHSKVINGWNNDSLY